MRPVTKALGETNTITAVSTAGLPLQQRQINADGSKRSVSGAAATNQWPIPQGLSLCEIPKPACCCIGTAHPSPANAESQSADAAATLMYILTCSLSGGQQQLSSVCACMSTRNQYSSTNGSMACISSRWQWWQFAAATTQPLAA